MKKIIALAALIIALSYNMIASAPVLGQNEYIDECEWYGSTNPVECFQDWYLFAYWPLTCQIICDFGQNVCLGLFPSSDQGADYEIDPNLQAQTAICAFIGVTGQYLWTFDAGATINYVPASGFSIDFHFYHGPKFLTADANDLGLYSTVLPTATYTLDGFINAGNGKGEHWFKFCPETVHLDPGFNGQGDVQVLMSFVYNPV
jgi:hypothetical protein